MKLGSGKRNELQIGVFGQAETKVDCMSEANAETPLTERVKTR
jgi:hypothetical protein